MVNDAQKQAAQYTQAVKATPGIHVTKTIKDNSGTHDKLFFLGNDGSTAYKDKLIPNQPSFTLKLDGMKEIEYNPNRGDNDLASAEGSYGMSGSFNIVGDADKIDYPNAGKSESS